MKNNTILEKAMSRLNQFFCTVHSLLLIGVGFALIATSASAFTSLNEDFTGDSLPVSLLRGAADGTSGYGTHAVNDGLTLTATGGNYIRSYVYTASGDMGWATADAPVSYTFTIDSWDGGSIWFYLVADSTPTLNGKTPEQTNAVVFGVQLKQSGDTYSLEFRGKAGSKDQAFDQAYKFKDVTGLTDPTGTFGFTIDTDRNVTLIANGQTITESSFQLSVSDYNKFNTGTATLYLSGINTNTGNKIFHFTNISVTPIPEPQATVWVLSAASLALVGFRRSRR